MAVLAAVCHHKFEYEYEYNLVCQLSLSMASGAIGVRARGWEGEVEWRARRDDGVEGEGEVG